MWALPYIEKLKQNETVQFRPRGHSMRPRIKSGELVTVSPDVSEIQPDDIVLCKVKGRYYVHLVQAVNQGRYKIGNMRNFTNGTIGIEAIFGKVIKVEP